MKDKKIAVIFDFDGTLIGDIGLKNTDNFILEIINANRHRKDELSMEELRRSNSSLDLVKRWIEPQMMNDVYLQVTENNIKSMQNAVCDAVMLKNLIEMRKHYKLFVFSGRDAESLEFGLRQLGLYDLFEMIISDTGDFSPKPNPDAILYIAKHCDISLDRCVYVGDKADDYDMAQRTGCGFIGAAWHRGIKDLVAVPEKLLCLNIEDLSEKIMHLGS
jgi:HAD superfamily hydrolase (TIGR01549 family)